MGHKESPDEGGGDTWESDGKPPVFELADPWAVGSLVPFAQHEEAVWRTVRALRDDANKALELARRDKLVGASLDAAVVIAPPADAAQRALFDAALRPLHAGDLAKFDMH